MSSRWQRVVSLAATALVLVLMPAVAHAATDASVYGSTDGYPYGATWDDDYTVTAGDGGTVEISNLTSPPTSTQAVGYPTCNSTPTSSYCSIDVSNEVELTAVPASGYYFAGWANTPPSGDSEGPLCTGTNPVCSYYGDADSQFAEWIWAANTTIYADFAVLPPPDLSSPPTISGSPDQSLTLSATSGTNSGGAAASSTYQWQDCTTTNTSSCTDIVGATSSTYVLAGADVGAYVAVVETMTNANGQSQARSNETAEITVPTAPDLSSNPTVSGTAQRGDTLTASAGTNVGGPAASMTYQWRDCDAAGDLSSCSNISGATSSTYTLSASDVWNSVDVVETITNVTGESEAASSASGIILGYSLGTANVVAETDGYPYGAVWDDDYEVTSDPGSAGSISVTNLTNPPSGTQAIGWPTCDSSPQASCSIFLLNEVELTAVPAAGYSFAGWSNTPPSGDADGPLCVGTNPVCAFYGFDDSQFASQQWAASTTIYAYFTINSAPNLSTAPVINGTAQQSLTLSASSGTNSGGPATSTTYQWRDCNSEGADCSNISGATGATYVAAGSDLGYTLDVVETLTSVVGVSAATSAPTAVITVPPAPDLTTSPTISGIAQQGNTLSVSSGTNSGGAASATYQWQLCDAGGDISSCNNITGATSSTYVLVAGDDWGTIRVVETMTNIGGTSSAASILPASVLGPSTGESTVNAYTDTSAYGALWDDDYDVVSDSTGAVAVTNLSSSPSGTQAIGYPTCGSTPSTYCSIFMPNEVGLTATPAARYHFTGWVNTPDSVTESDYGPLCSGSNSVCAFYGYDDYEFDEQERGASTSIYAEFALDAPPANTSAPTVSGSAVDGSTLTASAGSWSGYAPITYSYQWERCTSDVGSSCTPITGATGSAYVLADIDIGEYIAVDVTASNVSENVSQLSPLSAVVNAAVPVNATAPTVTGTVEDGSTLQVSQGSWHGGSGYTYNYQWQDCTGIGGSGCTNITGATTNSYVLAHADVGQYVEAEVQAVDAAGSSSFIEATGSALVTPAPPVNTTAPTLSGTAAYASTLSVGDGTWVGTPAISYTYQWQDCTGSGYANCSNITGATSPSYTLQASDIGAEMVADVTATNAVTGVSAASAASAVVVNVPPINLTAPAISGTDVQTQTLSANTGTWNSVSTPTYTYQWQRCNAGGGSCANIAGAITSSYTLGSADIGSTLDVDVSAGNGVGSPASATSATTAVIAPAPPTNTATPTLDGSAGTGSELSSSAGSWNGNGNGAIEYFYQWQRCVDPGSDCTTISGETTANYQPQGEDLLDYLQSVVTAKQTQTGLQTTVTSAPSSEVVALVDTTSNSPAGAVDSSYGDNGVTSSWPYSENGYGGPGFADEGVLDGENDLITGGESNYSPPFDYSESAVSEFSAAGALDSGFSGSGVWRPSEVTGTPGMAETSDGDTIVASSYFNGTFYGSVVWCLTAAGEACSGFATSGSTIQQQRDTPSIAVVPTSPNGATAHSGDIYVAASQSSNGDLGNAGTIDGVAVERLLPDGALDSSYGNGCGNGGGNGVTTLAAGAVGQSMVVEGDGSVIVSTPASGAPYGNGMNLTKLAPSGCIDTSWGNSGHAFISSGSASPNAGALALLSDGELVAAVAESSASGYTGVTVQRFGVEGQSESYGTGTNSTNTTIPVVQTATGSLNLDNIVAEPDGGVLLDLTVSGTSQPVLLAVNANGNMDGTFNNSLPLPVAGVYPSTGSGGTSVLLTTGPTPQPIIVGNTANACGYVTCSGPAAERLQGDSAWNNALNDPATLGLPPAGDPTKVGDPVNVATGNVYDSVQDMELKGRGPAAIWLRTYNSQSSAPGPMGYGWTTSYETSLQLSLTGDGDITEYGPTGAQLLFTPNGSGGYTSPAGDTDVLTAASGDSGGYVLTKLSGVQWDFNSGGQLQQIVDTNGNALKFYYTSATVNSQTVSRLTSMTNASGRTLDIAYNSAGEISSITNESDDDVVSYGYDGSGDLTSVTSPDANATGDNYSQDNSASNPSYDDGNAGGITHYQYDSAHELTDILTPGTGADSGDDQHFSYNAEGQAASASGSNNMHSLTFQYNTPHAGETEVTDASGKTTTYCYNDGNSADSCDGVANSGAEGDIESITDPNGNIMQYGFNSVGEETSFTDQEGKTTHYYYDAYGNLTKTIDPAPTTADAATSLSDESTHPTITSTYETPSDYGGIADLVASTTDADGNAGLPGGGTTTYCYNDGNTNDSCGGVANSGNVGDLESVTTPDGDITTYTYDAEGDVLTKTTGAGDTDGGGGTTDYCYVEGATTPTACGDSATGDLLSVTTGAGAVNAGGQSEASTTAYSYYPDGEVKSETDGNLNTTYYNYDDDGDLTQTISPPQTSGEGVVSPTTTNTYDARDNLISKTVLVASASGETSAVYDTTDYTYSPENQLLTTTVERDVNGSTTPTAETTTNHYNDEGSLDYTQDPDGVRTCYSYTALQQVQTKTVGCGTPEASPPETTIYTYTPDGQVLTKEDGDLNTTTYGYDGDGDLVSVTQPPAAAGGSTDEVTTYGYDLGGLKTSMTDADANAASSDPSPSWTYSHNADGELHTKTDSLGDTWTYTYDANDKLASETDANTNAVAAANSISDPTPTIEYEYDPQGQVTEESFPGCEGSVSACAPRQWQYDADGDVIQTVDASGTTLYIYNNDDELSQETLPAGAGTIVYGYDLAGERTTLQEPGATTSDTYSYDEAGDMISVEDAAGKTTDYSYDPAGRLIETSYPNGATTADIYDPAGRISTVTNKDGSGNVVSALTYGYDGAGNVIAIADAGVSTPAAYTYDNLERLISESVPAGFEVASAPAVNQQFGYDADGNRTSLVVGSADTTGDVSKTYTYNGDSNRLQSSFPTLGSSSATAYCYNADGELTTTAADSTTGDCTSGTTTSYAYDPEGDLVGAGGDTYVYDADGDRVSETENGVTTTQVFDGDSDNVIQQVVGADGTSSSPVSTNYVYGANGPVLADPTSDSDDADAVYYGEDALGSVIDLTNASSGAVTDKYAYDAFGQNLAHSGTSVQPFTFMGNEVDTATGDDDFNAREYDPALGTFLSQDPVAGNPEAPITDDAYVYGDDNPYAEPDPTGEVTNMQDEVGAPPSSVPNGDSYYLEGGNSENGLDFWGLVESGVEVVHTISGDVAFGATLCAIALSETVIGGAACASVALAAETVNVSTGAVLLATGKESDTNFAFNVGSLVLGGAGRVLEGVSETYEAASQIADDFTGTKLGQGLLDAASGWAEVADELYQTATNFLRGGQVLDGLSASGDLYDLVH